MTESKRKRHHDLYTATSPDNFRQLLAETGVHIEGLLSGYVGPDARHAVLLTGSLAEQVGNATSDVDLMVLLDDASALDTTQPAFSLRAGRALEVVTYHNGVEVNIDFFARQNVVRLMEALVTLAPALYDPTELSNIPMLQEYDLKFLHRLRTGWVLHNEDLVATWRDELLVDVVPLYQCIRHLNTHNELMEDAYAIAPDRPEAAFLVGRTCAELATAAITTHAGFTSPNRKWLPYWVARLTDPGDRELAEEGLAIMLRGFHADEVAAHLAQTQSLGQRVGAWLSNDPQVSKALAYLRQELSYVTPGRPT
jgi:hypothetical protein